MSYCFCTSTNFFKTPNFGGQRYSEICTFIHWMNDKSFFIISFVFPIG